MNDITPAHPPQPTPVITTDLAAVFDRLALITRSGDTALAAAAMDADLILRAALPAGAVEQPGLPAEQDVPPTAGDAEALARYAVDLLDRRARSAATAADVLSDAAAVEVLVTALAGRDSSRTWVAARAQRLEV